MDLIPLLGYIYIFALVGGLTLLFIKKIPVSQPPEAIMKMIETFKPMIQTGLIAFTAFYAIIWLANWGRRSPCRPTRQPAHYEPFQAEPGSTATTYIPLVQQAIQRVQTNIEAITELSSDVCGIVQEIENAYVGAKAGDVDPSEYALPKEDQQSRREARKSRAAKTFASNRQLFATMRQTKVLECFQSGVNGSDESELRSLAQQLQTLLEDQAVLSKMELVEPIRNALDFSVKNMQTEGFQAAPAPSLQSLSGPALIRAVEDLLRKESDFHQALLQITNYSASVRSQVNDYYRKADRLQRGEVTTADVKSSLSK